MNIRLAQFPSKSFVLCHIRKIIIFPLMLSSRQSVGERTSLVQSIFFGGDRGQGLFCYLLTSNTLMETLRAVTL